MIIGLTGTLASGKGAMAEYLKKRDFAYFHLSDEVRGLATENGIELTRKNLQDFANSMREKNGSGFFAEVVIKKYLSQDNENAVIDGIRNPAEINMLKKLNNFFLACVDAPAEIRFQRIKARNRENDPQTWEDFLKVDARDRGEGEAESGQQVARCLAAASFKLINDTTPEEFGEKIDELYNKLTGIKRPTWDEYFMKMASLTAERSTCLRHHIGAIIVKDKRILSTGYNGAARGVKCCIELGCIKDQLGLASGLGYETCRAIHAEQNAVLQGAFHGQSMKDGIMYCTHTPCMVCAKILLNAGIKEVVSYHDFEGDRGAKEFLEKAGVILRKLPRPHNIISFKD